ncbi:hypothetical protein VTK26DRAFT_6930 [Humicola hyalothermophila]
MRTIKKRDKHTGSASLRLRCLAVQRGRSSFRSHGGPPIARQVPPEHLPKVAKQLAEVLFQLHGLSFDRLGRLWCGDDGDGPLEIVPVNSGEAAPAASTPETSLEWFYLHRLESNREALKSHPHDPEWLTACWVLKTAVPHIIIEDRLRGPFPLCHLDLHHGNLLFDEEYNLTGVIDWSEAQTVRLERLVVSPEFVTFPAGAEEKKKKILAFKELVREHLQQFEESGRDNGQNSQPLLSQLLGSKRAEITHRCTYIQLATPCTLGCPLGRQLDIW